MIIIIEGPDGSGKTTLANQMSMQTGYPIMHRSKPETKEEKEAMYKEYAALASSKRNIILDRCWYSEMVYGNVMRDESVIDFYEMYDLEQLVANGGGMVIYCTGQPHVLYKRAKQRGEDYITDYEDFKAICSLYDSLMGVPHKIPVVRYTV